MATTTERARMQTVLIPAGVSLTGDIVLPPKATGLIIFAHGSGSSRTSSRNRRVAEFLQAGGLATMLFDLLTVEEEALDAHTGHIRFDVTLLAERLATVTDWIRTRPDFGDLPIGYFGASTGAAAALIAAAARPDVVGAVVSRGGRPDLAGSHLGQVRAPTLLIVGGNDIPVIGLNQKALHRLSATPKEMVIVPGATHLFEERGALDTVAQLALDWFTRHLISGART